MPKQEYKILEFHGGSNNKADPRDIPENQNPFSSLSVSKPGTLVMDGSLKNKYVGSVTTSGLGWNGAGLFFCPSDKEAQNYITYKSTDGAVTANGTDDNGILFLSDYNQIHAYTNGTWDEDIFTVSNLVSAQQIGYHYTFGGLRAYPTNYKETAHGSAALDPTSSTYNEYGDAEGQLITAIKVVDGSALVAGNIYHIGNGELVMCIYYDDDIDVMRCIRGFAGTHPLIHADGATISNAFVPRFFGLIDKTMFSETDNPEVYDIWTEDTSTLQQPRNTGHSTLSSGSAPFMDIDNEKALTVYEGSDPSKNPTNSEKVRLYFSEGTDTPDTFGIKNFAHSGNTVTATTVTDHPFVEGQIINISDIGGNDNTVHVYGGEWVVDGVSADTFDFKTLNLTTADDIPSTDADEVSTISGWANYTETADLDPPYNQGALKITIGDSGEVPGSIAGHRFQCYISGLTAGDDLADVNDKIFEGVRIDADEFYIAVNAVPDSLSTGVGTAVNFLQGIAKDKAYGAIDDNLKRRWKFGISWTYDSPDALEQQESLITTGWKSSLDELNDQRSHRESPEDYWGTSGSQSEGDSDAYWSTGNANLASADSSDATTTEDGSIVQHFTATANNGYASIALNSTNYLTAALVQDETYRLRLRVKHITDTGQATWRFNAVAALNNANSKDVYVTDASDTSWQTIDVTFKYDATNTPFFGVIETSGDDDAEVHFNSLSIVKESELDATSFISWQGYSGKPLTNIRFLHKASTHRWNERISGFNIYMKDITSSDDSAEWRTFCAVDFNRGVYRFPVKDNSEQVLVRDSDGVCNLSPNTTVDVLASDTYTTTNFYTPETLIDAKYKTSSVVGNRVFIGNLSQGGSDYPDKMLYSPSNKFDVFPETNFLDVATNDGEEIIHLMSFKDSVIQFKESTVYVVNVANIEEPFVEHTFKHVGIENPSQACLTNIGVCWVSKAGLILYDGEKLTNLTQNVEDNGFTIAKSTALDIGVPIIGYDSKSNRVIYTPAIASQTNTKWYTFDFNLNAHTAYLDGGIVPYCHDAANHYTNIVNTSSGDMVLGHIDGNTPAKLYPFKWSNSSSGIEKPPSSTTAIWTSKDIDFGSPAIRKKIYKVYVTYKTTGHSGITMKYKTDGGASVSTFDATSSTNYTDKIFQNTYNGSRTEWQVAELKPSSSINNIKSIQLELYPHPGDTLTTAGGNKLGGTATGGSSSTISLVAETSPGLNYYQNYCVGIYDGPARFNVRRINESTNVNPSVATVVPDFTDIGYTDTPVNTTSLFKMGVVSNDFTINDITIVYRMKSIK